MITSTNKKDKKEENNTLLQIKTPTFFLHLNIDKITNKNMFLNEKRVQILNFQYLIFKNIFKLVNNRQLCIIKYA